MLLFICIIVIKFALNFISSTVTTECILIHITRLTDMVGIYITIVEKVQHCLRIMHG